MMQLRIGDEVSYMPHATHTGVIIDMYVTSYNGQTQFVVEGEYQGQDQIWNFTDASVTNGDIRLDRKGAGNKITPHSPTLKRGERVTVDSSKIGLHATGTIIGHLMLQNGSWAVWVKPDQPIPSTNAFLWKQSVHSPKQKYQNSLYIFEAWVTPLVTVGVHSSTSVVELEDAPTPVASPVSPAAPHVMGIDKDEIDWTKFKKIRDML